MESKNFKKSLEEILRDTKHNKKAQEVFLKLYAKRKGKYTGWSDAKAETLNPSELK